MPTRILIVGNDPLARSGLATLLDGEPECQVVGDRTPESVRSEGFDSQQPDVIVWDLGWDPAPFDEPLSVAADIGVPVVALLPDRTLAAVIWGAGVRGLLPRDVAGASLLAAIGAARAGLAVLDPDLAVAALAPRTPHALPETTIGAALTPREAEVLALLVDGLPNKSIAIRLDISDHTVKFHVNAILGKLGARSRTEAAVLATRMGMLDL